MKKRIGSSILILAAGLMIPATALAQGTTYLSNLGWLSVSNALIGSDSWLAAGFFTGTNAGGYQFNSAQLAMANDSGSPNGFKVMLFSSTSSGEPSPGSSLGTLNGSASPATGGTFAYTPATSLFLSPNTGYFLVVTAGTAIASGAFDWANASNFSTYSPSGGWEAPLSLAAVDNYQSSNGSTWRLFSGSDPKFAINATAVPEPDTCVLLALGVLVCFGSRMSAVKTQSPFPPKAGRTGRLWF